MLKATGLVIAFLIAQSMDCAKSQEPPGQNSEASQEQSKPEHRGTEQAPVATCRCPKKVMTQIKATLACRGQWKRSAYRKRLPFHHRSIQVDRITRRTNR
jgi:hypothetical protein